MTACEENKMNIVEGLQEAWEWMVEVEHYREKEITTQQHQMETLASITSIKQIIVDIRLEESIKRLIGSQSPIISSPCNVELLKEAIDLCKKIDESFSFFPTLQDVALLRATYILETILKYTVDQIEAIEAKAYESKPKTEEKKNPFPRLQSLHSMLEKDCKIGECAETFYNNTNPGTVFRSRRDKLIICDECCYTGLCNKQGCGLVLKLDQMQRRCFGECEYVEDMHTCLKWVQCESEDYMCSTQFRFEATRTGYNLGCYKKEICELLKGVPDARATCCDSDLCNVHPDFQNIFNGNATDDLECPKNLIPTTVVVPSTTSIPSTPTPPSSTIPSTPTPPSSTPSTTITSTTLSLTTTSTTITTIYATRSSSASQTAASHNSTTTTPPVSKTITTTVGSDTLAPPAIRRTTPKVNTIGPTVTSNITPPQTTMPTVASTTSTTSSTTPKVDTNTPTVILQTTPPQTTIPTVASSTSTTSSTTPKVDTKAPNITLKTTPPQTTMPTVASSTSTTSSTTPKVDTKAPNITLKTTPPQTTMPTVASSTSTTSSTTTVPTSTSIVTAPSNRPPVTIPPVPHTCSTCGANPVELCEFQFEDTQCDPPNNYCMNVVTNALTGTMTVERKCVAFDDCYSSWWQGSSDEEICQSFTPDRSLTTNFQCSFCCVEDNCNRDIKPPENTLYKDN